MTTKLTKAQTRILEEVSRDGRRVYNGRARRSLEILQSEGLIDYECFTVQHTTGPATERYVVTPVRPKQGLQTHRLANNTMERKFSQAWAAQLKSSPRHLDYLLNTSTATPHHPPEASERDHEVAATVIQWLGSPVGQSFLADTLGHKWLNHLKMLVSR